MVHQAHQPRPRDIMRNQVLPPSFTFPHKKCSDPEPFLLCWCPQIKSEHIGKRFFILALAWSTRPPSQTWVKCERVMFVPISPSVWRFRMRKRFRHNIQSPQRNNISVGSRIIFSHFYWLLSNLKLNQATNSCVSLTYSCIYTAICYSIIVLLDYQDDKICILSISM